MSKAENRFEEQKHKEKQKRYWRDVMKDSERSNDEEFIGKMEHVHGKPCSCPMCCNPRHSSFNKSERLTLQERRADDSQKDDED